MNKQISKKRIALIACVAKKKPYKSKAYELYDSPLFKFALAYAKHQNSDEIYVLSAKYGLIHINEVIEPYNETLLTKSIAERKQWAARVLQRLDKETNLEHDEFLILAGNRYREFLLPNIKNYNIPVEGLSIGRQLQYYKNYPDSNITANYSDTKHTKPKQAKTLKQQSDISPNPEQVAAICNELHQLCYTALRFDLKTGFEGLPANGIYILFENGEHGHSGQRIVRIGTHTGVNQLVSRINQHFLMENKDRSIFRKNIGRSLLAQQNDPYAPLWELDTTSRADKEKYLHMLNIDFEQQLEKHISAYIQNNMSFVALNCPDKTMRLKLESMLISTVAWCNDCRPSVGWLGNFNSKDKIRQSGLWLVNELYKQPLTDEDLELIRKTLIY